MGQNNLMKSQFGAMGTPKSQQNGNILTGQKSLTKPIVLVNNGVN